MHIITITSDGVTSNVVMQDYHNEVKDLFYEADSNAGDKVEVLYTIDSETNKDIILWRKDWLDQI